MIKLIFLLVTVIYSKAQRFTLALNMKQNTILFYFFNMFCTLYCLLRNILNVVGEVGDSVAVGPRIS